MPRKCLVGQALRSKYQSQGAEAGAAVIDDGEDPWSVWGPWARVTEHKIEVAEDRGLDNVCQG